MDIRVNGELRAIDATDSDILLYELRNTLKLKGTRFGCGAGHCGACTVLVDGRATTSCDMPMWGACEHHITTVEYLTEDPVGTAVQGAFLSLQAAQCGYCINGIMMSTTSLLKRTASPTDEEILDMLHRHLCRCGAHVRILEAIRQAAAWLSKAGTS